MTIFGTGGTPGLRLGENEDPSIGVRFIDAVILSDNPTILNAG
jgi:hypothetical protein